MTNAERLLIHYSVLVLFGDFNTLMLALISSDLGHMSKSAYVS